MVPVASFVSEYNDRRTIVYLCPKCKQSLEMLGRFAFKCPHCNIGLEWEGLPMKCSPEFRDEYEAIFDMDDKKFKKKSKESMLSELLQSFINGTYKPKDTPETIKTEASTDVDASDEG